MVNETVQADVMTDDKEVRQKYIDRVEVLDKVKKLFLIPQLEMMTLRQISEFYEVDYKAVEKCYQRNKKEIDMDGAIVKKPLDFAKIAKQTNCLFRPQAAVNVLEFDGVQVVISNRGVRCFSKRAVLRFGMLLRDSKIAQEVRTQLLNTFEQAEKENPQALTKEIDKEKELLNNVAMAFASGDMMKFAEAAMKLNAYKDRHIKAVEENNKELINQNKTLSQDNDILSGNILEWSNRSSANKIVRLMATELKWDFGTAWNEIYNELLYRHNINLKTRKTKDGRSSQPLLSFLHDDEWQQLYSTIAAMLQARYVNPSRIFERAKKEVISK